MTTQTILMIFLAISFVVFILGVYQKQNTVNQITDTIIQGNTKELNKLLDKRTTRFLLPQFSVDCARLNAAIYAGDDIHICECFKTFQHRNLNKIQMSMIGKKEFWYSLMNEDSENCRKCIDRISDHLNQEERQVFEKAYEICAQHEAVDSNTIDALIVATRKMNDDERSGFEYVISKAYENHGDVENAKLFLDAALKHSTNIG